MLELLLCAPQTVFNPGAPVVVTLQALESGTIYPSRLVAEIATAGPVVDAPLNMTKWVRWSALTINNGSPQIKGVNGFVPGGVFAASREGDFFNLPPIPVRAGTQIALTGEFIGMGVAANALVSVPFLPSRFVSFNTQPWPDGPEIMAGAAGANAIGGCANVMNLTFQDNGIFDLSRLTVNAHRDVGVGIDPGNLCDSVGISNISFQGNQNFCVGDAQGAPPITTSAGLFSPYRKRNFVNLGRWRCTQGSILAITFENATGVNLEDLTYAVPQIITDGVPAAGAGSAGCPPNPCR